MTNVTPNSHSVFGKTMHSTCLKISSTCCWIIWDTTTHQLDLLQRRQLLALSCSGHKPSKKRSASLRSTTERRYISPFDFGRDSDTKQAKILEPEYDEYVRRRFIPHYPQYTESCRVFSFPKAEKERILGLHAQQLLGPLSCSHRLSWMLR